MSRLDERDVYHINGYDGWSFLMLGKVAPRRSDVTE